jgi:predicted phage terminase large subunit-like protein
MKKSAIREDGSLLMPKRLTKEFLDSQKKTQGVSLFSCQYLNDPVPEEDADFKKSDFRFYEQKDLKDLQLNKFMAVDPALSKRSTADYSAIVVGGFDSMDNMYILDIFRERVNPKDLVNQIFLMNAQWQPRLLGIEVTAFQQILSYVLREEMRKRGEYLPLLELRRETDVSKENRILSLQPKYLTHTVFHPKRHPKLYDLHFELARFPKGATDDIIDAESDLLQLAYPAKRRSKSRRAKVKPTIKSTGY